jgi:glycosyltransferase involved in cell wall biosynthesis
MDDLDIAIVHKQYEERGGAERVAETLAETFDAPLFAGFVDDDLSETDLELRGLFDRSHLSPLIRRSGLLREVYAHFAWQYLPELADYDVLIQTAPQPGWYVPTQDQLVIRYTHDLPRTVYDRFQLEDRSLFEQLYAHTFRVLFQPYLAFPDRYIANSELVARRLSRYWDVNDASVVYPPTDIEPYHHEPEEDHYLTYSRLTKRKQIDEIIDAFSHLPDKQLIVGGSGPAEAELRAQADGLPNVSFEGYLSEERKIELLSSAKALIFAAESESFGMVPIEAFASGKPVIGIDSGFTRYQIQDGHDGLLYDRGAESLADAVSEFERDGVDATPQELMKKAEQYSTERFRERMIDIVNEEIERTSF